MANFKVKYLDSYPVYGFYESFEYPEAVFDGFSYDIIKTEEKWGHVYDSINENRTIQYVVYENYKCEIIIGRNIDIYVLQGANHVLVTPDYGEQFNALDFKIDMSDSSNRDKTATITFKKELTTNYPLSSDYAETLHSSSSVNKISATVTNPSFALHWSSGFSGADYLNITVTSDHELFDALYDVLSLNDYLYVHDQDGTFKQFDLYEVKVITYTTSTITFQTNRGTTPSGYTPVFVLDFEPDWYISSNVSDIDYSLDIYTFLEPKYDKIIEGVEGSEAPDGIQEYQKVISRDVCNLKFWLKESEKWKADLLLQAKARDTDIVLDNHDDIIPSQMTGILTKVEKDTLIDLYEYDVKTLYNTKVINSYR